MRVGLNSPPFKSVRTKQLAKFVFRGGDEIDEQMLYKSSG